jgi:Ca2+-binding EF-hand superfamily protein
MDPAIERELKLEIDLLFKFFDGDNDGKITVDEVMQVLKSVN